MPGGDRTGPMGAGPMTGRQAGYCTGETVPGSASAPGGGGRRFGGGGRGFGGGGRGRRGWRNQFFATGLTGWQRAEAGMPAAAPQESETPEMSPAAAEAPKPPLDQLKSEAQLCAEALEKLNGRIAELEAELQ